MVPEGQEVKGRDAVEAFIGRHVGEFAGIAATGNQVRVPYTVFYDLHDGQIESLRLYRLAPLTEQLKG